MIYKYLPYFIFKPLFGDRKRWGTKPNCNDKDYKIWSDEGYMQFYEDNQKGSLGTIVNNYGFKIVSRLNYNDRVILEIGPGHIEHIKYNNTKPLNYYLTDIIKKQLDDNFICERSVKKPFAMLLFDLNLSWSFIYRKKQD